MLVMVSNHSSMEMGYLAGKYPGGVGHLYSPGGWRNPRAFMPYALDNGAYGSFLNGTEFDDEAFTAHCMSATKSRYQPLWVAVPDVVCDAKATRKSWAKWADKLKPFGWPLAFVVQDGMESHDIPNRAAVVFVGGSKEWKMSTIHYWCERFPRVHVGRINTWRGLWAAHNAGAESVDGTGWFHRDQYRQLAEYLEQCSTGGRRQLAFT